MVLIFILYALFASTFSLGKLALSYASPVFWIGIRMFLAGIILLAYQYIFARNNFRFERRHLWLYAQISIFNIYIHYVLRSWAMLYLSPAKASLLYNLGPFITFIMSYFIHSEKITYKKVLGLAIGFCGLLPVLLGCSPAEAKAGYMVGGCISLPEIAILIAVTMLSYSWFITKQLTKDENYDPTMVNGISMTTGGFLALCTAWCCESTFLISNDWGSFLMILGVVIVVSNLLCHTLYTSLLRKYSPTLLALAGFMTPLFAALYSWLFTGEIISWHFFVATLLVALGLFIFYQEEFLLARKPSEVSDVAEVEG